MVLTVGVGIDLVELDRVSRMLDRWGDRLLDKVLAPQERAALPSGPAERVAFLARSIALKEAASKAIGTGWSRGVHWRQVAVLLGPEPEVRLTAAAAEAARRLGAREGRTAVRLEDRGPLVLGHVRLLA